MKPVPMWYSEKEQKYLASKVEDKSAVEEVEEQVVPEEQQPILCRDNTLAHHWIIEPSGKGTSKGYCKRCQIEKTFYNSIQEASKPWANNARLFENRIKQLDNRKAK